jgi:type II secretory pathway pseudopilin PulG
MTTKNKHLAIEPSTRRGAALLELILAIALFVGAAALIMRSMRTAVSRVSDSGQRLRAIDVAQSRLAEFSSGLVSIRDAQLGVEISSPWIVDVSVEPSAFENFSLVVVTVRVEEEGQSAIDSFVPITIRQLIRSDTKQLEFASGDKEPEA